MFRVIVGASIAVLMMSAAFAASSHRSGARPKSECRCYTDKPNCSGNALFSGTKQKCAVWGYPQSCVIYSSHGNSDLRIYVAEQTFSMSVGYGDTYACAKGTDGVPGHPPRKPIGVK